MNKIIHVIKGDEYRAKIETEFTEGMIFADVFRSAQAVLAEILSETDRYETEQQNCKRNLHEFCNNIILFTADRGEGKTSAMQSFARYLANPTEQNNSFFHNSQEMADKRFEVLDSIDPSALHDKEDIIRVLISRLFYRIMEKLENHCSEFTREKKADILSLFQTCYDNIDYLNISAKERKEEFGDDLEALARLGSSARLRENLYELIKNFLLEEDNKKRYLVIPIDDVDLVVRDVFDICDKIHNFLSLPNVIIIMAINYEQLKMAIYQRYLRQHEMLVHLENKLNIEKSCYRMAVKYLEKIFPAGHNIELPKIDDLMMTQNERLFIKYTTGIDTLSKNIQGSLEIEQAAEYQECLARELYARTGIVILNRPDCLNPFLPKTLRELTHFLKLLSDMKPISFESVYRLIYHTIEESENELLQEVEILKRNLQRVKHYFLDYWCAKHLFAGQQGVISDIDKFSKNVHTLVEETGNRIKQDFESFSVREQGFHGLLQAIEENSKMQEMQEFQSALYFYFTIYLNENFAAALGNPDRIKNFMRFLGEVCYYPDVYIEPEMKKAMQKLSGSKPLRNYGSKNAQNKYGGYVFGAFTIRLESCVKGFNVLDTEPTEKELKFVDGFCFADDGSNIIVTKPNTVAENRVENLALRERKSYWRKENGQAFFDTLRPVFQILTDENSGLIQLASVKRENDIDATPEVTSLGKNEAPNIIRYISEVVSILVNCEVQQEISKDLETICKFYNNAEGKESWINVSGKISKVLTGWTKYAEYLGSYDLDSLLNDYICDESYKNYFLTIMMSNDENMKQFVQDRRKMVKEALEIMQKNVNEWEEIVRNPDTGANITYMKELGAGLETSYEPRLLPPVIDEVSVQIKGNRLINENDDIRKINEDVDVLLEEYENVRNLVREYFADKTKFDYEKIKEKIEELTAGLKQLVDSYSKEQKA